MEKDATARDPLPAVRREDCEEVVASLLAALRKAGLAEQISFAVYGSYFGSWRDGISDLDAIMYFHRSGLALPELRTHIIDFQTAVRALYERFPFLAHSHFFTDVFVLDRFHAADCRFVVFDTDFMVFHPDQRHKFGER